MLADERMALRISALFRQGLQADGVRVVTDLAAVSEVWPVPRTEAGAAWYIWLTTSPGAYEVRLATAETIAVGDRPFVRGLMTVRYFPARAEPVFSCLTADEQELLLSPVFDETHTPRFELADRVPEDFFGVGTLELFVSEQGGTQVWMLAAPDPFAADPPLAIRPAAAPPLPSWQVAYPVFDALIGLTSYVGQQPPARVLCSRRSVARAQGWLKAAMVAFGDHDQPADAEAIDRLAAVLSAAPWRLLCRYPANGAIATECCRVFALDRRAPIPWRCSETWWTLARLNDPIASMPCGCHH